MKKRILKSIIAAGFLMLLAAISSNAQTNKQVAADIPFDFYVKNEKFSAGKYIIERASNSSSSASVIFRQKDGKNSRLFMMTELPITGRKSKTQPSLIFNRYGSDYFLAEILNPADDFGAQVPKVRKERNLAKASGAPARETVTISSDRR